VPRRALAKTAWLVHLPRRTGDAVLPAAEPVQPMAWEEHNASDVNGGWRFGDKPVVFLSVIFLWTNIPLVLYFSGIPVT